MRVRGAWCMRRAIQIDVFTFYLYMNTLHVRMCSEKLTYSHLSILTENGAKTKKNYSYETDSPADSKLSFNVNKSDGSLVPFQFRETK